MLRNILKAGLFGVVNGDEYFVLIEAPKRFIMVFQNGNCSTIGEDSIYSFDGVSSLGVGKITAIVRANSFSEVENIMKHYNTEDLSDGIILWKRPSSVNIKELCKTGLFGVVRNEQSGKENFFVLIENEEGFNMIYDDGDRDQIGDDEYDYNQYGETKNSFSKIVALIEATGFRQAKSRFLKNEVIWKREA